MKATIKHLESKFAVARYELIIACFPEELQLYLFLKLFAINSHSSFPSYATIQEQLGWSNDRLTRVLKQMEASGHLQITRVKGRNSVYDITWYDEITAGSLTTTRETRVPGTRETRVERIESKTSNTHYIRKQPEVAKNKLTQEQQRAIINTFLDCSGVLESQRNSVYSRSVKLAQEFFEACGLDLDKCLRVIKLAGEYYNSKSMPWSLSACIKNLHWLSVPQPASKKQAYLEGDKAYQKNGTWFVITHEGNHCEYVGKAQVQYR